VGLGTLLFHAIFEVYK